MATTDVDCTTATMGVDKRVGEYIIILYLLLFIIKIINYLYSHLNEKNPC